MEGRAYRALVLKYDVLRLPPEIQQKVAALLRVQEEFRRWAAEWAKSGGRMPIPQERPLRYLAREFVLAHSALKWLRGRTIKHGMKVPLILNAQLRLNNERDAGRGVLVDAPRRELRVRKLGTGTIVLPLGESAVRWVLERVREGARLVLAMVWVEGGMLRVALVFRREVEPMQPRRILAVDFNALHNGIAYAVVERNRVLERSVLRPDVLRILRLQKRAAELDSPCARRGGPHCEMARAANSRLWRLLREFVKNAAKFVVKLALQYRAAIVVDAPESESMQELRQSNSYPADRKALLNFGRLRGLVRGLAAWYGVPYIETRLYSTVCPKCGAKMQELPERRAKCAQCGLEVHRDGVPAMWAQRRLDELLKMAKSQPPSFSSLRQMLISPRIPVLT